MVRSLIITACLMDASSHSAHPYHVPLSPAAAVELLARIPPTIPKAVATKHADIEQSVNMSLAKGIVITPHSFETAHSCKMQPRWLWPS